MVRLDGRAGESVCAVQRRAVSVSGARGHGDCRAGRMDGGYEAHDRGRTQSRVRQAGPIVSFALHRRHRLAVCPGHGHGHGAHCRSLRGSRQRLMRRARSVDTVCAGPAESHGGGRARQSSAKEGPGSGRVAPARQSRPVCAAPDRDQAKLRPRHRRGWALGARANHAAVATVRGQWRSSISI